VRRDSVRRYLDQAGFQVLPEVEISRDDVEVYRKGVDDQLSRSVIFVQLLSENLGRPLKGSKTSRVALQHERALLVNKPILQWRRREAANATDEIPEDHQRRLNGTTVVANDLSEFKALIVETVNKLTTSLTSPGDVDVKGIAEKLVFVNAEETDIESARVISKLINDQGIGTLPPARGDSPDAKRAALKMRMLACDGMVLVHGNNPDWPVCQWDHFRKVKAERQDPIRAIGFCDLPPPDKPISVTDVLNIPTVHLIDCRNGLIPDQFATFLKAL
jgi:hypothetical protein